nr:hypothetical protein [Acidimicrobiia bacterium]
MPFWRVVGDGVIGGVPTTDSTGVVAGGNTAATVLTDDITALAAGATERLTAAATLDELRDVEQELLGKRGRLAGLRRNLGALAPGDRPAAG